HADIVGELIDNGKIRLAISIKISHHTPERPVSYAVVYRGLESAVAIAQIHRCSVVDVVRHHQIGLTIPIEFANDDGVRLDSCRIVYRGLESAIAIAQK